MEFLNAVAIAAVVWFLLIFTLAFRRNLKIGYRAYNIGANTAAAGLVGLLWLIFGGA